MRSARLRHRIELHRLNEVQSESGEMTSQWVLVTKLWSGIEPVRGQERLEGGQKRAGVDTLIVLRYRADLAITERDRLVRGDTVYNIVSAINVRSENTTMEIMATSNGVNDGR
ncbi:phage head closure protein [Silvimonas sp.]|uniref:phage head closure protein n=1 Tax=Silvimonas sp. TaxID=2650811 RepID=UPI00283EC210|nr:phage head closure protein [Silvimonas sp.]MDR3427946.1 phage head closure protein [Silvimonas sp.]